MAKSKYFLVAEKAEFWDILELDPEEIKPAVDRLIRRDLFCEEDIIHVCKITKSYEVTRKINIETKEV